VLPRIEPIDACGLRSGCDRGRMGYQAERAIADTVHCIALGSDAQGGALTTALKLQKT